MDRPHDRFQKLEKKRPGFFTIGLVIACSATLVAFEWGHYEDPFDLPTTGIEEEDSRWEEAILPPVVPIPEPVAAAPNRGTIIVPVAHLPPETMEPRQRHEPIQKMGIGPASDAPPMLAIPNSRGQKKLQLPPDPTHTPGEMPYACDCASEITPEARAACTDRVIFQNLSTQLRYPQRARETGQQGVVLLMFVVGTDGSVGDIQVIRSISPDLDRAAVKGAQSSMPCFKAGRQGEQAVPVYYKLPVNFVLR